MASKPFSLSLGPKRIDAKLPATKTATKPVPKPKFTSHDSDPESDAEGAAQEVSHFDAAAGGAIHEEHKKEPKSLLVIKSRSDGDWREQARRKRQKGALPGQDGQNGRNVDVEVAEREEKERLGRTNLGLNIMKNDQPAAEDEHAAVEVAQVEVLGPEARMTEDDRALAALKGEKFKSDLVITSVPQAETEEEAFQEDYQEAPSAPSQADYARIPVEEFGAALLRGMGWKDGEDLGGKTVAKAEDVKRRPALLGIGAKSEAATGVELGTWGQTNKQKGKGSRRAVDQEFTPVVLQNKKTGERLTEEQLQERMTKEDEQKKIILVDRRNDQGHDDSDYERGHSRRKRRQDYDDEYYSTESKRSRKERHRDHDERESRYTSSRNNRSRSRSSHSKYRSRNDDRSKYESKQHYGSEDDRRSYGKDKHRERQQGEHRDSSRRHDRDRHERKRRDRSRSSHRRHERRDERR